MRILEVFAELFRRELIQTEGTALRLLHQQPLNVAFDYVAVPWSVMINEGLLGKLPAVQATGGFTVCQHISYEHILPVLKKMGIRTLFTPHVWRDDPDVDILPFPHLAVNADPPAQKDIFFSFIGAATHPVRDVLFALPKRRDTVIQRRPGWHFYDEPSARLAAGQQYRQVLSRSRFSLCPRGTGASTLRFWESLKAGAIPILLSDAMRLPAGFEWDSAVLRVAEGSAAQVEDIIRSIPTERERKLRENCLRAYELNSGDNFVRCIRIHYGDVLL